MREQTLLAEELLVDVEGLADAVGEQHQRLAWLGAASVSLAISLGRHQPEHATR